MGNSHAGDSKEEAKTGIEVENAVLQKLAYAAWSIREQARVVTGVRVGSALLTDSGEIYAGCNVEHKFRCHDIHAEVNAVGTMIASGGRAIRAIVVVAETSMFTPCGGCMDWIFEFSGGDCVVGFQGRPGGPIEVFRGRELMPKYPAL